MSGNPYTRPACECCKATGEALQRVKLTYLCRECVRTFVAAWAKAGVA